MSPSENRIQDRVRTQLDRRFDAIRGVTAFVKAPEGGWISTLRKAYGMTQGVLARRMGRSQQAISQLEQREAEGAVTLEALQHAARALDAELVYAIIPRRSIQDILEERAGTIARGMIGSVRHSMRLEDQEPEGELEERVRALAEELLESPSTLWSDHPHAD